MLFGQEVLLQSAFPISELTKLVKLRTSPAVLTEEEDQADLPKKTQFVVTTSVNALSTNVSRIWSKLFAI